MRLYSIVVLSICLLVSQIGASATPRIINGKDARQGDWPWMIAIINSGSPAISSQFCGGTLIHPSWVLTGAHCTNSETTSSIQVLLGRNTLSRERTGKIIRVKRIIQHPDFDNHPENPTADIALLELASEVKQPVLRIADYHSNLPQNVKEATVIGWGAMQFRHDIASNYADKLQQVTVPIVANDVCNASYEGDVKNTMLCAGFADGGTDACVGDSGGPLVAKNDTGWQQIGIVSWGEGCALPSYYGVYTHVPSFQKYITELTCEPTDILPAPQLEVSVNEHSATVLWTKVEGATGYQFYYAPYSEPFNAMFFDNVKQSIDFGSNTSFTVELEVLKAFRHNFHVTVRAYQGNCYSADSNVGSVIVN